MKTKREWFKTLLKDQQKREITIADLNRLSTAYIEDERKNNPGKDWIYFNLRDSNQRYDQIAVEVLEKHFLRIGYILGKNVTAIENIDINEEFKAANLVIENFGPNAPKSILESVLVTYEDGTSARWGGKVDSKILEWNRNNFIFYLNQFRITTLRQNNSIVGVICFVDHPGHDEQKKSTISWVWIKRGVAQELRHQIYNILNALLDRNVIYTAVVAGYNKPSAIFFERLGFEIKWVGVFLGY